MLCARVIRGISSIENAVTPRSANAFALAAPISGSERPTMAWASRTEIQVGDSDLARGTGHPNLEHDPGLREQRGAVAGDPGTLLFVRRVGAPRRFTGAVSTITSRPAFVSTDTDAGTIATRRSP